MMKKNSYLFLASMLAIAGVGCGDDDTSSTDAGTDSGSTTDAATSDGGGSDGGTAGGNLTFRIAHLIAEAGPVGICVPLASGSLLVNGLFSASPTDPPEALEEGAVTPFLSIDASALPAAATLAVYPWEAIDNGMCPSATDDAGVAPLFTANVGDLNLNTTDVFTVGAIGSVMDGAPADRAPQLNAFVDALEPADSASFAITVAHGHPAVDPVTVCLGDEGDDAGAPLDLLASDTDGLAYGESATIEAPPSAITATSTIFVAAAGDCDGDPITSLTAEQLGMLPGAGEAGAVFATPASDNALIVVANEAPAGN